jgi:hypothetical protein
MRKPDYYILPPNRYWESQSNPLHHFQTYHWGNKKWAQMGGRRTDQLILSFGSELPQYIEYGSLAIASLLNNRYVDLFSLCVSHLQKAKQKYLITRCKFICDNGIRCVPLTKAIAQVGLNVLSAFRDRYTLKGNVRNTINDILIFSTAFHHKLRLRTDDCLLNRFSSDYLGGMTRTRYGILEVTFPNEGEIKPCSQESKGYINRSWQVMLKRAQ